MWANSGDSHIIEPLNLFDRLPDHVKERLPRSVKDPSGEFETIYVDGLEFRRDMPQPDPTKPRKAFGGINARPIGTTDDDFITRVINGNDAEHRIKDLDDEGVWGEVIYPGLGIWQFNIRTPEVARLGARVMNEFVGHFQSKSPRWVCCATLPLVDVDDAIAEIKRCRDEGFLIAFLPVKPPNGRPEWHDDEWAPMWAALEEAGMHIGFHIGTEPMLPNQRQGLYYRGAGGAILNYVETSYGGQRCAMKMVASGALDRHPDLKVLVSEGGATWVPFLGDRMNEAFRQHSMFVKPKLSAPPKEILFRQVYASFQHDESAPATNWAMGYKNVMWGSDYPHIEGTFGHTQKTLHELFDDVAPDVRERITHGAFKELFPHVSDPPAA